MDDLDIDFEVNLTNDADYGEVAATSSQQTESSYNSSQNSLPQQHQQQLRLQPSSSPLTTEPNIQHSQTLKSENFDNNQNTPSPQQINESDGHEEEEAEALAFKNKRFEEEKFDQLFVDHAYLSTLPEPLQYDTIMNYFCRSPYYDPTCNNAKLK